MKADINVTPLIDVLLVLLIIFLLVAPMDPRGLNASLPRTADSDDRTKPAGLVVEVGADDYRLNTSPVLSLGELDERLRSAFERGGNRTVFGKAKGDVPYERVVAAVDAGRGAGATRIGLLDDAGGARR